MGGAMQGRTTLMISNRIGSLRNCDLIVVLEQGRLVQQGTHEALMQQEGPYRRLAELQMAANLDLLPRKEAV